MADSKILFVLQLPSSLKISPFYLSNVPTRHGHFGVGHSRDTKGSALQGCSGLGHSRDHSRDTEGWTLQSTPGIGSLNSALGVLRGVLEDQAETGRGVVAEFKI